MSPLVRARLRAVLLGALGIGLFLAAWEAIEAYRLAGASWPRLSATLAFALDPARATLFRSAMANTFSMAAGGYAIGAAAGIALGALAVLVRALRPGVDRLVSVIHAIPSVALAPVFIALLDRDATGIAIAAMIVGYALYVATTSGLAAASDAHRDLFAAFGASPLARLWRLEIPAALPALAGGLRLAIPGALIGAIIGEWFGASRGLELLMVSAMHNFQIPLLWSAALITAASPLLGGMLTPLGVLFSSIPVVALIPVLARLFGCEGGTVVAIFAIISFLPAFVFTGSGLRALPPGNEDVFRAFGAGRLLGFSRLVLPAAVPAWMIALRLVAPTAILAALLAGYLIGTSGLGYLFRAAGETFDTESALGTSVVATVVSALLFGAALAAEGWVRRRWT